jgi:hypothetical protein
MPSSARCCYPASHMRAAIFATVFALACGGKSKTDPAEPTAVAPVEASCVLGADGANCTFSNKGAEAGSRCFKVLYGHQETGAVVSSDKVCSPKLAGGAVAAVAVRFARRPGDACGPDAGKCTVKVVEPDAADAVAAAWQDELKAPGSGPLTEGECKKGGEHTFDLILEEEKKRAATDEERQRVDEFMKGMRERMIEEFTRECPKRLTRVQYDCLMQAKTGEDVSKCERK